MLRPNRSTDAVRAPRTAAVAAAAADFEVTADGLLKRVQEPSEPGPADQSHPPGISAEPSEDASWATIKPWQMDILDSLARGGLTVRIHHLARSTQLNPLDQYIPREARDDLDRLLKFHQKRIRELRQGIANVRQEELVALKRNGRLPTAEEAASPELKDKAKELALRDVRLADRLHASGKPAKAVDFESAYADRLVTLLTQETAFKLFTKAHDEHQWRVAKHEWCPTSFALREQGHVALMAAEAGHAIIDWFQRHGCLPSGEAERLVTRFIHQWEAIWNR